MKSGQSQSLQVIGTDSSGNRIPLAAVVAFGSDNERVAQVDGSGTVTAKQAGKAVITARYGPFLKATLGIKVASKAEQPERIEIGQLKPMKAGLRRHCSLLCLCQTDFVDAINGADILMMVGDFFPWGCVYTAVFKLSNGTGPTWLTVYITIKTGNNLYALIYRTGHCCRMTGLR
nr:Ig-like domain-containing protein [Paenibacillus apiarius]